MLYFNATLINRSLSLAVSVSYLHTKRHTVSLVSVFFLFCFFPFSSLFIIFCFDLLSIFILRCKMSSSAVVNHSFIFSNWTPDRCWAERKINYTYILRTTWKQLNSEAGTSWHPHLAHSPAPTLTPIFIYHTHEMLIFILASIQIETPGPYLGSETAFALNQMCTALGNDEYYCN